MLMMALAMLIMPILDVIAKYLAGSISAGQVAWCRFALQSLLLLPLVLRWKLVGQRSDYSIHLLRGTLLAAATLFFFIALKYLPLADAIAIFFVEPLLVTLLAALFLGENVGWRRFCAIAVGLLGALLVIRPNFEQFGWVATLPLCTAICFAIYLLITRRMAQRVHPAAMQFYAGLGGTLAMSVALLFGQYSGAPVLQLTLPDPFQSALLLLLGFVATCGHLLLVYAFRHAPVSVLAPLQYIEIISATLFGLLFFSDFPDTLTWCGVAIIILSGLYVFYRERKLSLPDA